MLKVVMDALAEIKPERREVIEKVIIEGLSYREAAKECNCSHDAIMRKLDKGIFNIRMNFPVAYYRHFNSDSWISLLEERESFKKMTK
jgi:IS30 family transposase